MSHSASPSASNVASHSASVAQVRQADDLIARARALIPTLRARAAQAERDCSVPVETVRDFHEAGFFRILQPARWGGYELDPEVFYAVQMAVAEGCMSSAWILGVIAVHNWQLGLFDLQAQEDVWGRDSAVLISSSYMPKAKVTPVEGGYRISGRWGFSSGVDHCDWAFLGGLVPPADGQGEPDYRTFLVPRADFTVLKVWDTLGLRGTGSHDVVVEDAFVPAYRSHRSKDGFAPTSPGLKVNTAPLFRLPFGQIFVRAVSTSAIGALAGALADFTAYSSARVAVNDFSRASQDPVVQELIADTEVAIDEMKLVLERNFAALMDKARSGQPLELKARLHYRYQSAQVLQRCCELVSRMVYAAGAHGIYRSNPLTRVFVDLHTGRTHVANAPQKFARNYGAVMLGAENGDLFI